MIRAKHSKMAQEIWALYLRYQFKQHFHGFYLMKTPQLDSLKDKPVLIYSNHSTWWDGFFLFWLNKFVLHRKPYLMMKEDQLSKFLFFRKLGAYSVDSGSIGSLRESVRYTLQLFRDNNANLNSIIIFPQGELQPFEQYPVRFRRGMDFILKRLDSPIAILPIGIKISWLGEQRSDVLFWMDDPIQWPQQQPGLDELENRLNEILHKMNQEIAAGKFGNKIFSGKSSIHKRFGMR